MLRVLIYSNNAFTRKGIKCFLDTQKNIEVLRDSELPETGALDTKADGIIIVVVDLCELSDPTGTVRRIRREMRIRPNIKDVRIVAMCSVNLTNIAVDALDAGAAGIVTGHCQPADLYAAIVRVANGDNYIQPDIAMDIFDQLRSKEELRREAERLRLTVREGQVISHLMQGKTNRQIGESLCISEKTVKHYVGVLKEKLCVANRLELVLHAQRLSL